MYPFLQPRVRCSTHTHTVVFILLLRLLLFLEDATLSRLIIRSCTGSLLFLEDGPCRKEERINILYTSSSKKKEISLSSKTKKGIPRQIHSVSLGFLLLSFLPPANCVQPWSQLQQREYTQDDNHDNNHIMIVYNIQREKNE